MPLSTDDIRNYLGERLGVDTSSVADDTPLFSSELLDSFSMVELLTYLEQESGVRFAPSDVRLDNLDTIAAMMRFVAQASGG
jgi:acyl carrier protein